MAVEMPRVAASFSSWGSSFTMQSASKEAMLPSLMSCESTPLSRLRAAILLIEGMTRTSAASSEWIPNLTFSKTASMESTDADVLDVLRVSRTPSLPCSQACSDMLSWRACSVAEGRPATPWRARSASSSVTSSMGQLGGCMLTPPLARVCCTTGVGGTWTRAAGLLSGVP